MRQRYANFNFSYSHSCQTELIGPEHAVWDRNSFYLPNDVLDEMKPNEPYFEDEPIAGKFNYYYGRQLSAVYQTL
jgi:hypothetical protein